MKIRNLLLLLRNVRIQTFEKGEIFIKVNSTERDVYFIRKGLVRSFYTNDKVEEITFQLYAENQLVSNAHCILFDEPSKFTYQAVERTKVYTFNFDTFTNTIGKDPRFIDFNRGMMGKRVIRSAFQRVEGFVLLSPEERYQKYVKDFPSIVRRAPDKYIANVLGITAVSLSRIRGRIASKKG